MADRRIPLHEAPRDGNSYVRQSGEWVTIGSGGGLTAVVDDTTPQLGGNLDSNGFNVSLTSGSALVIWDATNTDSVTISHDGTDLNTAFVTTDDWNITGLGGADPRINLEGSITVANPGWYIDRSADDSGITLYGGRWSTAGGANIELYGVSHATVPGHTYYDAALHTFRDANAGNTSFRINPASSLIEVRSGDTFRVYDNTNTDYVSFSHDGTNFNHTCVNTNLYDILRARVLRLWNDGQDSIVEAHVSGDYFPSLEVERTSGTTKTNARWTHIIGTAGDYQFSDQTTGTTRLLFLQGGNSQYNVDTNQDHIWQHAGNAVMRIDNSATGFYLEDGYDFRIFDATNTDYIRIRDNGSNSSITTNNNTIQIGAGNSLIQFVSGQDVRIYDSLNTDYVSFSHDGTNFNIVGTSTAAFNFSGGTTVNVQGAASAFPSYEVGITGTNGYGQYILYSNTVGFSGSLGFSGSTSTYYPSSVWLWTDLSEINLEVDGASGFVGIRDATALRIYDDTDTDYGAFSHNGTDFYLSGTNTDWFRLDNFVGGMWVMDGKQIRVADSLDTDYMRLYHDGTHFYMNAVNTDDIVLRDIQEIVYDASAGTAPYNNTYTGIYWLSTGTTAASYYGLHNNYNDSGAGGPTTAYIEMAATGPTYALTTGFRSHIYATTEDNQQTSFAIVGDNGAFLNFWVLGGTPDTSIVEVFDGSHLRILDSAGTDYVDFNHDGTNFNADFTNTLDWDIDGLAEINLLAGADLKVWDATNVETFILSVQSTYSQFSSSNDIYVTGGINFSVLDSLATNKITLSASSSQALIDNDAGNIRLTPTNGIVDIVRGTGQSYIRIWDSTTTDYCQISETGSNTQINANNNNIQISSGGGIVELTGGQTFRIRDAANTDNIAISHDGTDVNIVGTNTTDINWSGITNMTWNGGSIPYSSGTTGGTGSAGAGNQYVQLTINGTTYKLLHDGTV